MKERGLGLFADRDSFTVESLTAMIKEVFENPVFVQTRVLSRHQYDVY